MEKNDTLILNVVNMLLNKGVQFPVSKMPDKNLFNNAKDIDQNYAPNATEMKLYLDYRISYSGIETSKANYYLLIPYSPEHWKVFVVDCNGEPYAQLEDYHGQIMNNKTTVHEPLKLKR